MLEVQIDLPAVNSELMNLEERIVLATGKHDKFIKELGSPVLS